MNSHALHFIMQQFMVRNLLTRHVQRNSQHQHNDKEYVTNTLPIDAVLKTLYIHAQTERGKPRYVHKQQGAVQPLDGAAVVRLEANLVFCEQGVDALQRDLWWCKITKS